MKTKKLTTLSMLTAIALTIFMVEAQIPPLTPIPGIKMGLSNIATVFALYTLGWPYAICVSAVRVVLSALLFGNVVGLIYSLSGAALALLGMILLQRLNSFSSIGVSVAGGVLHNAGQIIAACIVMKTVGISVYFIPLVISGTISGVLIGVVSGMLVERIKKIIR